MELNTEERNQYSRPTKAQLEIAALEDELNNTRNRLDLLDNYNEKLVQQRDQVRGALRLLDTGKRQEGVTLDVIRHIVGWKR